MSKRYYLRTVNEIGPTGGDGAMAVDAEGPPERPASFFQFRPIFWRHQGRRDLFRRGIESMESHHLYKPHRSC
jgi:hypothetical protein